MFISVIFYLLIFIEISHQNVIIKLVDGNSEGSSVNSVPLTPSYFIKTEVPPSSSISCFDRINFTTTKSGLKKFLSLEKDETACYGQTEILNIKGNSSIVAPKSKEILCFMDDVYKQIKLIEVADYFFLFATGCYLDTTTGKKLKGGFIYQKENNQIKEDQYIIAPVLQDFGFEESTNVIGYNLLPCHLQCSGFFNNLKKNCKYINDPTNEINETEVYIFIGVAFIFFISSVLFSVFYYNSNK